MTDRPRNIEEESEAIEDAIEDGYAHHTAQLINAKLGEST